MPLNEDQLARLTKIKENPSLGKKALGTFIRELARPHVLGVLQWFDEPKRCTSRGCGSPCMIKIRDVPLCTSHALTELNRIIAIELMHIPLDDCTCKAGVHSRGNVHTETCAIYNYGREGANAA